MEKSDAFLRFAVVVGIARKAQSYRAGDESIHDRVLPFDVAHRQRSGAAAEGIGTMWPALGFPKIRKNFRIAPAAIAQCCPMIVVTALAPVVD